MQRIYISMLVSLPLLATALATAIAGTASREGPSADRFDTVVLDAGHGGDDEGARGPHGLLEKDVVLDVTRHLAARLEAAGVGVVLTRGEDVFVPLEQRTAIANDARADLFLSIHANAHRDRRVRGIETFFLSLDASDDEARRLAMRENQALGTSADALRETGDPLLAILGDLMSADHLRDSQEFARLAQSQLAAGGGEHSRGVKQAPFVVLAGVQMPASLVEIGFITNASDEASLQARAGRDAIVAALEGAIAEFGRRFDARRGRGAAPAATP